MVLVHAAVRLCGTPRMYTDFLLTDNANISHSIILKKYQSQKCVTSIAITMFCLYSIIYIPFHRRFFVQWSIDMCAGSVPVGFTSVQLQRVLCCAALCCIVLYPTILSIRQ